MLNVVSEGPATRSSYSTRNLEKFRSATRMQEEPTTDRFRYNLRLKLAVVEGVRNIYYDYAYAKADQVADLRRELFNESVEIVSGSDFRLHVWYRIEGVNRMSFSPKRPFSEPTQISRKKAFKLSLNHPRTYTCPLPSASHILVPGLKTIFLLWKPPYSTSKLSS